MMKRMKESVLILINAKGTEGKIHINILSNLEHSLFSGVLVSSLLESASLRKLYYDILI